MKTIAILLALLTLPVAASAVDPFGPDAERVAAGITAERLRSHIAEISSDEYQGRGPGTEGDRMTREYLSARLAEFGFEPGGPDGWEQPMPIVGIHSHPPKEWTFHGPTGDLPLRFWDEYMGGSGTQDTRTAIDDAELVFVGYGIVAPEENWDDYKGEDMTGKILVMLNNDPEWDPDLFAGSKRLYYGRWTYKYEIAAKVGAVGAIIIHTTPSAGYPWQVVQTGWSGEQFELPAQEGVDKLKMPAWVTWDSAERLVALGGYELEKLVAAARTRDFRPVDLNVRTSIAFENTISRNETANVVGILPGRDPELSKEYVVYTCHHDHLGVGEPDETGDRIYNGAVDNAAGCAQVLEIARAFGSLPERPRRSIMVLPVAAEEQGLLGSRFFSQNPTVHPGYLAANINIDGGNILGRTRDVAVVGKGKSDLEARLAAAAKRQDRVVVDEPYPDKGYYYRSDQLNFARIGVPALYFKSGNDYREHGKEWGKAREDEWRSTSYHQPSDELTDDWDFSGMVEDARLAFRVGLSVAERDELPAWTPGDEFEAIRKAALDSRDE